MTTATSKKTKTKSLQATISDIERKHAEDAAMREEKRLAALAWIADHLAQLADGEPLDADELKQAVENSSLTLEQIHQATDQFRGLRQADEFLSQNDWHTVGAEIKQLREQAEEIRERISAADKHRRQIEAIRAMRVASLNSLRNLGLNRD